MAGWDLSPDPPENIYTIHHPTGDVKKISYYQGITQLSHWFEAPRTFHWKVPTWTKGSTERGSSGAPMFNSRGLIVGHLHGGSASCFMPNGYDNFGGLYFDWASGPDKKSRLRDVLNPTGRHVSALKGAYLAQLRNDNRRRSTRPSHHAHHRRSHHHHHHDHRHPKRPDLPDMRSLTHISYTDATFPEPVSYHYPEPSTDEGAVSNKGRNNYYYNSDIFNMIFS